ncbi:hypothetical protein HYFRA_00007755 [Hymenoscyphus fraxineus]|uniref:Uncharacterized protein n=1 Tax=Hymenoscyphus fraxineus TaxID=746836 RepID=A0A9N9PNA0_9HELO|nr:hypothetical protein HYFRA_00007755 [Hymenoscyphus fraxineus]
MSRYLLHSPTSTPIGSKHLQSTACLGANLTLGASQQMEPTHLKQICGPPHMDLYCTEYQYQPPDRPTNLSTCTPNQCQPPTANQPAPSHSTINCCAGLSLIKGRRRLIVVTHKETRNLSSLQHPIASSLSDRVFDDPDDGNSTFITSSERVESPSFSRKGGRSLEPFARDLRVAEAMEVRDPFFLSLVVVVAARGEGHHIRGIPVNRNFVSALPHPLPFLGSEEGSRDERDAATTAEAFNCSPGCQALGFMDQHTSYHLI